MPNYSKSSIVLMRYPFSDLSNAKVRPAVVVSAPHTSQDVFLEQSLRVWLALQQFPELA